MAEDEKPKYNNPDLFGKETLPEMKPEEKADLANRLEMSRPEKAGTTSALAAVGAGVRLVTSPIREQHAKAVKYREGRKQAEIDELNYWKRMALYSIQEHLQKRAESGKLTLEEIRKYELQRDLIQREYKRDLAKLEYEFGSPTVKAVGNFVRMLKAMAKGGQAVGGAGASKLVGNFGQTLPGKGGKGTNAGISSDIRKVLIPGEHKRLHALDLEEKESVKLKEINKAFNELVEREKRLNEREAKLEEKEIQAKAKRVFS